MLALSPPRLPRAANQGRNKRPLRESNWHKMANYSSEVLNFAKSIIEQFPRRKATK
jgi:hypothetical protein